MRLGGAAAAACTLASLADPRSLTAGQFASSQHRSGVTQFAPGGAPVCLGTTCSLAHLGSTRFSSPATILAYTILSPTCTVVHKGGQRRLSAGSAQAQHAGSARRLSAGPARRLSAGSAQAQRSTGAHLHLLEQGGALGDVAKHGVAPIQQVGTRGGQLRLLRRSGAARSERATQGQCRAGRAQWWMDNAS